MLGAHLRLQPPGTASAHHSWTTTAPHSWITARHSWTVLSTAGSRCPAQAVLQIPACFGSCWPRAQHVRDPQLSRGVPPSPYQGALGPMLNPMTPGAGGCRAAGCSRAVPREKQLRGEAEGQRGATLAMGTDCSGCPGRRAEPSLGSREICTSKSIGRGSLSHGAAAAQGCPLGPE